MADTFHVVLKVFCSKVKFTIVVYYCKFALGQILRINVSIDLNNTQLHIWISKTNQTKQMILN